MKNTVLPHAVVLLFLGVSASLSAQNLPGNPFSNSDSQGSPRPFDSTSKEITWSLISYQVPALEKVRGEMGDETTVFNAQHPRDLDSSAKPARDVASVVDLDVLKKQSPYRRVAVSGKTVPCDVESDGLAKGLAAISATYRETGKTGGADDCPTISLSVEQRIKLDPSLALETIEREIQSNPACACEIIKSAIQTVESDVETVVTMVETAIHAAPESMRIISQCAIAASPESLSAIQSLLARLDPAGGDVGHSSKGAKSAKSPKGAKVYAVVAPPSPNPLDLPPPLPPLPPIPPIDPDPVTDVDPVCVFK